MHCKVQLVLCERDEDVVRPISAPLSWTVAVDNLHPDALREWSVDIARNLLEHMASGTWLPVASPEEREAWLDSFDAGRFAGFLDSDEDDELVVGIRLSDPACIIETDPVFFEHFVTFDCEVTYSFSAVASAEHVTVELPETDDFESDLALSTDDDGERALWGEP